MTTKTDTDIAHALIKYSNKFGDTIALHNDVADLHGHVWFGKMGTPLSEQRLWRFKSQIESGDPTWLYLVRREKTVIVHKGKLVESTREYPKNEDEIPSYYAENDMAKFMKCWFRVQRFEKCKSSECTRLVVASSLSKVIDSIKSSTVGFFIVRLI